jgi:hypothetical protein
MGKHRRKAPAAGAKTWITLGLILAGVVGIIILNGEFANESALRRACFEAQAPVLAALDKLRKEHPDELQKTAPADLPALLARSGGPSAIPTHPAAVASQPSPYKFGANGAFYCTEHGTPGTRFAAPAPAATTPTQPAPPKSS